MFVIRQACLTAPTVRILLVEHRRRRRSFFSTCARESEGTFPRDAFGGRRPRSDADAVQAGEPCPGHHARCCFGFLNEEATPVHSATIHPRLSLTRREQQIVPLIAQGLTNKEIGESVSCPSEKTVKNHR